jgi:hypothetical protein
VAVLTQLGTFAGGLGLYLFVCAISVAAGMGLVHLLRVRLPRPSAMVLAPVLTLAFWSVALGFGVPLGFTVRQLTPPLWVLTLGLALYGVGRPLLARRYRVSGGEPEGPAAVPARGRAVRGLIRDGWLPVCCAALPVAVMYPYFRAGLADHLGSSMPDGWFYVGYGQYLCCYSWKVTGGLSPLHAYPAGSGVRYITASLLGFLSPFYSPGDTQASQGLFLAWSLFCYAAACAFLGLSQQLKPHLLLTYLLFVVFSGWSCNVIWAANYENLLALAYFPALAATIFTLREQTWPGRVVLALLTSGMLYTYPELAPFVLGGALLILVNCWWQQRAGLRDLAGTFAWGLALTVVFTLPYLGDLIHWFQAQFMAASQTRLADRPGIGIFPGLLNPARWPAALWALGSEGEDVNSWPLLRNLLGAVLSVLAALGLARLARQRRYGLAAVAVLLLAGALVFLGYQRYDYGAYKLILIGWWAICLALVLGLDAALGRLPAGAPRWLAPAVCLLTAAVTWPFNHPGATRGCVAPSPYERLTMRSFRTLEELPGAVGDAPLLVAVDDWLANEWATYFLRDQPINLCMFRMFMAVEWRGMEKAKRVPFEETRYVLTDDQFKAPPSAEQQWRLVWSGGPYRLWDPGDSRWALRTNLYAPYECTEDERHSTFRLGGKDTVVEVVASRAGFLALIATFTPEPEEQDETGAAPRRCLVRTDAGYDLQLSLKGNEDRNLVLPVHAGINRLTLRASGGETSGSGGDLPALGVYGLSFLLLDDPPSSRDIPLPVEPVALSGMTWKDGTGIAQGGDPRIVFALEKPQFVHALRLKYSYAEANGPAHFRLSWKRNDQANFDGAGRSVRLELSTGPGERTETVLVRDTVDQIRIDPDDKPCVFTIAEIVLQAPALPLTEREKYRLVVGQSREAVKAAVPAGAAVLVIHQKDDDLLDLPGREGRPFPQSEDGSALPYNPENGADAIAQLEAARRRGGQYLLIPKPAYWWLEEYKGFKEHLEKHYRRVADVDDACLIYDLR